MKNKATAIKIVTLSIMSIMAAFVLFISNKNTITINDIRTRAQEDDANYCQNNCGGDKDPCTGTNIGDNYYDPVCCGEIKKTGDPFACGNWVNRTWCFPDECSTIPEGVTRQRCSAARTSYCDKCKEHGCYGSPTSAPQPTTPPQPTTSPVNPTSPPETTQESQPTQPAIQPTQPAPTTKPFVQLTPAGINFQTQQHGNGTTQQEFNLLNFIPKINFPDLKFSPPKIDVDELQKNIAKPLDILESIFGRIVYYDRQLESGINEKVGSVFK